MHSGKGRASASSQATSVTGTAALVGGEANRPPAGSTDGTTRVRRTAARRAGSASSGWPVVGLATSASTSTSPAFSSGWSPTRVADVAPRGRQQPASPQVQKSNRACEA